MESVATGWTFTDSFIFMAVFLWRTICSVWVLGRFSSRICLVIHDVAITMPFCRPILNAWHFVYRPKTSPPGHKVMSEMAWKSFRGLYLASGITETKYLATLLSRVVTIKVLADSPNSTQDLWSSTGVTFESFLSSLFLFKKERNWSLNTDNAAVLHFALCTVFLRAD